MEPGWKGSTGVQMGIIMILMTTTKMMMMTVTMMTTTTMTTRATTTTTMMTMITTMALLVTKDWQTAKDGDSLERVNGMTMMIMMMTVMVTMMTTMNTGGMLSAQCIYQAPQNTCYWHGSWGTCLAMYLIREYADILIIKKT